MPDRSIFDPDFSKPKTGRMCGPCRACCTSTAVEELAKPEWTACVHETSTGCGIYRRRPKSCAEYECGWKMADHVLGDNERPDLIGVYFVNSPATIDARTMEPVTWVIDTWESRPNGSDGNEGQRAIEKIAKWAVRVGEGRFEGLTVRRFGEKLIEWIPIRGGKAFHVVKPRLTMTGYGAAPYRRRRVKPHLPVVK